MEIRARMDIRKYAGAAVAAIGMGTAIGIGCAEEGSTVLAITTGIASLVGGGKLYMDGHDAEEIDGIVRNVARAYQEQGLLLTPDSVRRLREGIKHSNYDQRDNIATNLNKPRELEKLVGRYIE